MLFKCSRSAIAVVIAASFPAIVTCSEDDAVPNAPAAGASGSSGSGATGAGGSSGAGASGNGGSSGSASGTGGTAGSSNGGTSAGSGGASGGTGAGGTSSGGTASGDGGPPPPADGGGSIYAVECRGDSRPCGYPAAHCLGIQLPDGGVGYSCSNHCTKNADCSSAPSGAEAQAGCVPFTQQNRCMLVCENSGTRARCPTGMTCYTYPGAQIGYCLWM
jgi:hypothetical protein